MDDEKPHRLDVLAADALRGELTLLARSESDPGKLRKAALALLKADFQRARDRVRSEFEGGSASGMSAARALSGIQDQLIQVLYDFATKHFYYAQNPTESERLAIVATGGYGRAQLAPGSDIDLLFVRPFKQTAWGESVIEFVLHMLWDMGLKVGHATRSLAECTRLARQDSTIRTSLLEARWLWGDRTLFDDLRKRFWADVASGTEQNFVETKLAEREARHRRQGESRYLVEPNIKDGKGGLRDLQTLYWIGKYLYHVDDPADLVKRNVFTQEEYRLFQTSEAFLWNVRCRLHWLVGRAEERLSFDVQSEIARGMGYAGTDTRRSVEAFMREYFLVAKQVGDLTRIFCAALEEQNRKRRPSLGNLVPGFLKPRSDDEVLYVENGRLNARVDAFARDPVNLLRIFHLADSKRMDVHPHALRTITRSLDLVDDALRNDPAANRLFLEILSSRNDPVRTLRWLNEAGVLARFVPAFAHAVGLMQFNMYHHYTVDEHLIRAVGNVAAIERGELKQDHPLSSEIIKRVKSREILYCAIFLHDIAKGLGGNHSKVGGEIAQSLCPRLGFSAEDTATVAWLVRNHLVMSDTAQRRDIADPQTVRDFVAVVQSPEMLRLLLVLTVADIRAVGPGVWNGWKGQLLRELYLEAEGQIAGRDSVPARSARVQQARHALEERLADLPDAARERALQRHHDGYWLAFDHQAHEQHARLIAGAENGGALPALAFEEYPGASATEVVVYTPDHPGLFSQLAGAIAATGGSIVDAKAFTTWDGFALDIFSVQDAHGAALGDPARMARLERSIADTLAGKTRRAAGSGEGGAFRRRAAAFEVRGRINFDNEASASSTIVEVEGADRPGLLSDVADAIFAAGFSISSAMVATYGERAMDVFYMRNKFGHKITNAEQLESLRSCLLKAIEGPLEASTGLGDKARA